MIWVMLKITVDRTKCSGLGLCEATAPDIFEVDDGGDLVLHEDVVTDERRAEIDEAVTGCPTQALSVTG